MPYSTYILKSVGKNSFYVGSTSDIEKRLVRHNSGQVLSTKRYLPWKLVYFENFATLREARATERKIKSYTGGEAFKKLIKNKQTGGFA